MKRILLTGAGGFIGSHLLRLSKEVLPEECELVLLTSQEIEGYRCILHRNYQYTTEDFAVAGVGHIDCVVHMGHFVQKQQKDMHPADDNFLSIRNTRYLLNHLPNIPKSIVYCSTMGVYGNHRREAVSEDSRVAPQDIYSVSKLMCEGLVKEWGERNGCAVQILRLSHVYGPGDRRHYTIPIWLTAAGRGEPILVLVNPAMNRNCLYVEDCCRAILSAARLEDGHGIINVASRNNATMMEIASICREVSGNGSEIVLEPMNGDSDDIGLSFQNRDKCERLLGNETWSLRQGLQAEYEWLSDVSNQDGM